MIDKFIFVHIYKTAGTSFWQILRDHCRKRVTADFHDVLWYLFTDVSQYEEFDIIYGHFTIEKYAHLNRPQITIMREPVERLISEYFWVKNMYKDGNFKERSITLHPHPEEKEPGFRNICDYVECRPNVQYHCMKDLSNFDWIGVTEYFNESMQSFFEWFGTKMPDNINKVHRRKNLQKGIVTNKQREYIKKFNLLDYELYTDVLNRYKKFGIRKEP